MQHTRNSYGALQLDFKHIEVGLQICGILISGISIFVVIVIAAYLLIYYTSLLLDR